jgi:hypothetical protein
MTPPEGGIDASAFAREQNSMTFQRSKSIAPRSGCNFL